MKLYHFLLLNTLACAFFSCTSVKENGHIVFSTSSNLRGLHYHSPAGSVLDIDVVDNAAIHKEIGTESAKVLMSGGTAILTSALK